MLIPIRGTVVGFVFATSATFALTGCGGGGGGDIGSNGRDETPIINQQPRDATVTTGTVATFSVGADGNRLHYTWLRDGQPIVGGPDRPQYSVTATYKDNNHHFSVLIVNDAGQITSNSALLTLALTPDQSLLESGLLDGGYYTLNWKLSNAATQTAGTDFFFGERTTIAESPLFIGPVATQESFTDLTKTLGFDASGTTPVLLKDFYDFEANFGPSTISYTATGIDSQDFDVGGTIPGRSYSLSEFVFTPLTGPISSTPADLKLLLNAVIGNPAVLDQTVSWQPGAGYLTFKQVADQDQFVFQDCNGQPPSVPSTLTVAVHVSPCSVAAGASISETMTAGIYDPVNQVTHVLADGAVSNIGATSVWVAAAPNAAADVGQTVTFLAFVQSSHGQVFQGSVTRAGTVIAGSNLETTAPNTYAFPQVQFRVNAAALATLQAASQL